MKYDIACPAGSWLSNLIGIIVKYIELLAVLGWAFDDLEWSLALSLEAFYELTLIKWLILYDFLAAFTPQKISSSIAFAYFAGIEFASWFIVVDHAFRYGKLQVAARGISTLDILEIVWRIIRTYRWFRLLLNYLLLWLNWILLLRWIRMRLILEGIVSSWRLRTRT